MTERLFILLFIQIWVTILAQQSPYSLQAAVEALHRREEQLALKDNHNLPGKYGSVEDNEYWDDEPDLSYSRIGRLKINQLLARQLAKDRNDDNDFDDDNYFPLDERKRSFFRERDEKYGEPPYPTVFRERELEPYKTSELAEEFLREIQKEKELERREKFRETLRRLWENYQQQENEVQEDLFDGIHNKMKHGGGGGGGVGVVGIENGDSSVTNNEFNNNPYYLGPSMERKRSYPVLPWLPASKKKRFPVAKRSPKITDESLNMSGTNEKVVKDLQAIFGQPKEEKKRSTNDAEIVSTKQTQTDQTINGEQSGNNENSNQKHNEHQEHNEKHHGDNNEHDDESDEHDHDHDNHDDNDEHDHEHDHDHEHEDDDDDEHDHENDDDENEDRKKKRDLTTKKRVNLEVIKEDQIIPGDLTDVRNKKSIQWSKYFGIDKRKRSNWYPNANKNNIDTIKNIPEEDKKKRNDIDPEKIESMDNKLKSIEDYIIDETIKYTGAHEGLTDPDEIRHLKDHVVSRLATAYNLEKMRLALEKLRQSIDNENHLQRNEILESADNHNKKDNEKEKRVAVKKEKVEFDHSQHSMGTSTSLDKTQNVPSNNLNDLNDDSSKQKKKRTGIRQYSEPELQQQDLNDFEDELGAGHFEPLNDNYFMGGVGGVSGGGGRGGGGGASGVGNSGGIGKSLNDGDIMAMGGFNQCPLLDTITDRCGGINIISGDIHQDLLQVCNIHQLCYLCGTSQVACDFQYLSEADSICGQNNDCQSAARSALMILRGVPGPQLGPKECFKNPCLYKAMREIGL